MLISVAISVLVKYPAEPDKTAIFWRLKMVKYWPFHAILFHNFISYNSYKEDTFPLKAKIKLLVIIKIESFRVIHK